MAIRSLPFASGTVTFETAQQTLSITNLPFTPTKVFISGPNARLHLDQSLVVWGSFVYDENTNNNYHMLYLGRLSTGSNTTGWAKNASDYITITSNGFSVGNTSFLFAANTEYFWVAIA